MINAPRSMCGWTWPSPALSDLDERLHERNGRDSADVDVSPGHRLDELALAVTPAVTSDSRGGSSVVFDD